MTFGKKIWDTIGFNQPEVLKLRAWNSYSHGNSWVHRVHTAHMKLTIKPWLWFWNAHECHKYEFEKAMNSMTLNFQRPWFPWLWIQIAMNSYDFHQKLMNSMTVNMDKYRKIHTAHMTFMNNRLRFKKTEFLGIKGKGTSFSRWMLFLFLGRGGRWQ